MGAWLQLARALWPLLAIGAVLIAAVAIVRSWRHEQGLAVQAERDACAELAAALTIPPGYDERQRVIAHYTRHRIARAIRARGAHVIPPSANAFQRTAHADAVSGRSLRR